MPVTERLMAAGSWDLALDPATPRRVLDALDYPTGSSVGPYFGHVFVFDSLMAAGLGDATMIASARWAGIVRTRNSAFDVGGVNMAAWLGDEDGKGPLLETAVGAVGVNNSFGAYKAAILSQCPAVSSGITTAPAGTTQAVYQYMTAKAAFDALVTIFAVEYRVNHDASMDSAPIGTAPGSGGLFVQSPSAIVMRRSSGRDLNVVGIPVVDLKVPVDADSYISRVVLRHTAGYTAASGSAVPYKDLLGNTVKVAELVDHSTTTPSGSASAEASNIVAAGQVLHQQVSLSSDLFDLTRDVKAGDWINVYDVDTNLLDRTNPVRYRGEVLFPVKQRVMGITWALERGMGIWYRDLNGVWTDLTPYFVPDQPVTTLEIGASTRQLRTG